MPDTRIHCVVTSPPYFWLRDYGVEGQIGLEERVDEYIDAITDIMNEVRRVLRSDGVAFFNVGDTFYSKERTEKARSGDLDCGRSIRVEVWALACSENR